MSGKTGPAPSKGGASGFSREPRFRPHLGEFPKFGLPLEADGVQVTLKEGIYSAKYHFPGNDAWVTSAEVKEQQNRCFTVLLGQKAKQAGVSLEEASSFAGDALKGNHSFEEWKSAIKADVWAVLFPPKPKKGKPKKGKKGKKTPQTESVEGSEEDTESSVSSKKEVPPKGEGPSGSKPDKGKSQKGKGRT